MKIVIDIPDILMEYIVKGRDLSEEQNDEMALAIANGTPLPEHHGRLIDADFVSKNASSIRTMIDVNNAPTIMEGSESE